MLVPQLVRAKLPTAIIGFFMHVAFPSSEIFRCLSVREYLLHGMLSADLIGFQTANYARHFRQTVSRILSQETLPKGIHVDDHFVDVGVFPVGIDVKALKEKRQAISLFFSIVT
jgi:trehalose-6-phosphate synthase